MAQPPAEIARDIGIEIDAALIDEAHDAQCDDQFGDRGDADGIVGGERAARRAVGKTTQDAGLFCAGAVEGHQHGGGLVWRCDDDDFGRFDRGGLRSGGKEESEEHEGVVGGMCGKANPARHWRARIVLLQSVPTRIFS